MNEDTKRVEPFQNSQVFVAIGSFLVAAALAFISVVISPEHDIAAGVIMVIAQFLLLCATIFGVNFNPSWFKPISKK